MIACIKINGNDVKLGQMYLTPPNMDLELTPGCRLKMLISNKSD